MKDASGELSMTAVAVVAIAAVATLFATVILPAIRGQINTRLNCANVVNCDCTAGKKTCNCTYLDESNNEKSVKCPNNN